ncbi:hypothetical protein P153DRAFT_191562 [Dothidotthia symphoricarpi CBS 119687]|uniref:Uncharacterized protein n=1 Tax=Dothidotthia symphoricarpi CBS 119687 TaxID=1392245 RepID=A0A6A6AHI0_9PLEO|nr:uncharacterized protein P153DRAFT_191562 [Dothidotthia symphoricarpi CBS 119687]KAF2131270.1 hypothetical protein P153DRAFT_191562 [Dothidotthia symphoricarpi CBS 119687]
MSTEPLLSFISLHAQFVFSLLSPTLGYIFYPFALCVQLSIYILRSSFLVHANSSLSNTLSCLWVPMYCSIFGCACCPSVDKSSFIVNCAPPPCQSCLGFPPCVPILLHSSPI